MKIINLLQDTYLLPSLDLAVSLFKISFFLLFIFPDSVHPLRPATIFRHITSPSQPPVTQFNPLASRKGLTFVQKF